MWIFGNFYKYLFWETSTNGCFCKLQKAKLKWSIKKKNKIYCLLWTDCATCSSVFIVDFEQVSASWEAKCGVDCRIYLNASKPLWKQSKWDQQNFLLIFLLKFVFAFLLHLLIGNFKPESHCSGRNNWIWCLMVTILSYIKSRSTARITIMGYSIPRHLSWFINDP